jgi:histidinol-phosphatase (PHP family)
LHPKGISLDWSMKEEHLEAYVDQVLAAMGKPGPRVRLGLEADFFPETVEKLRVLLAPYPFDYVIGSVHFADSFQVDAGRRPWEALSSAEREEKWEVYWRRVAGMAQSRAFDFAGHLDLPKRFVPRLDQSVSSSALAALDAIAEAGMAMEINTSGWLHPAKEAYPSPALLREARKRNIPILINADAHKPKQIAQRFEDARALAREAGYSEVVRYEKRERFAVPL